MILITILTGVYKPTNITGGAHIVLIHREVQHDQPCLRVEHGGDWLATGDRSSEPKQSPSGMTLKSLLYLDGPWD